MVFTEKIHGKNNRLGLILDRDDEGNAQWFFTAGSHEIRRKERAPIYERFDAVKLADRNCLPDTNVQIDQQFKDMGGRFWKVTELRPTEDERVLFKAVRVNEDGTLRQKRSEFWTFLTDEVRGLLEHIRDEYEWHEPKTDIIVYGEYFGYGVQTMQYGRTQVDYRAFDNFPLMVDSLTTRTRMETVQPVQRADGSRALSRAVQHCRGRKTHGRSHNHVPWWQGRKVQGS